MSASRTPDVRAAKASFPSKTARKDATHAVGEAVPIVAIGASAGGLEACRSLLGSLPTDTGLAFIFVQHLAPDHESLIVDLLRDDTGLTVVQAADAMEVEADHLYVIPPGALLALSGNTLQVTAPPAAHGARLPFDFLLQSIAKERGSRAACIILSGTGADGSVGLAAIKQGGGLVLVQKPEDAAYDGMPRSAISTGLADKVLPIGEMPAAIIAFMAEGTGKSLPEKEPDPATGDETLSDILQVVRANTPHDFSAYKIGTLERRIEHRMGSIGIEIKDRTGYLAQLRTDPLECENLAKDLLINVTNFFRDKQVFETVQETVIPGLLDAHSTDQPFRIWIAGCSTGEEAYSLAMLFREELSATKSGIKLQIFASDADEDAVMVAREGFYPREIEADVSAERLARFFVREEGGYRVLPELRANVVFTVQNLLSDPPFSRIDMVSCRNLLIYLRPEAQARVISLFHFALRDGGVLLLGSSETVGKADSHFRPLQKAARIYRHVGRARPGELIFSLSGPESSRKAPATGQLPAAHPVNALAELCRQTIVEHYAPAAVLVSQTHECLYTAGPVGRYLKVANGYPTTDLFAMTPARLHTKIRSAIQRCGQQNKRVIASGGEITHETSTRRFSIYVDPVDNNGERLFLLCFVDDPKPSRIQGKVTANSAGSGRISELEAELEATRTELNGAISNLEKSGETQKAINEEALSYNEEYQSTNEELLTSKEELQSLNEELTALNGQLQETLEKQRTSSNDLQNILYSTAVATLFLDAQLKIRFFTPATRTLFNVIAGDIGRPLADLNSLAVDTTLLSDAHKVLADHQPVEMKIEAKSGLWYMRRIMPYLDEEHAVEGVVITFVDVSELRRTSQALIVAKQQADLANAAKSRFLAAASHDLRQPLQTLSLLQSLLVRKVKEEPAQKLLVRFESAIATMSGMLNDLLDINEIESGKVSAIPVDFAIGDLLARLRNDLTLSAESKDLELRVVGSSLMVHTDQHLLEQMLRNLLSNALKYTNTGRILLGCRRRGNDVSIEVWDTGIGIPEAELKRIFDEYHQIDNPARERAKGLGLGLSIVQRLGQLLGHDVDVKSRQTKGSVFSVRVKDGTTSQASVVAAVPAIVNKPELASAKSTTILIVEDDPEILELLGKILRDEGHLTLTAADGPQALALMTDEAASPDLIISDYNLPNGMNGSDVVREIRRQTDREVPAIILSGDISARALADVSASSLIRLSKPVNLADVAGAIEKLLSAPPAPHKSAVNQNGGAPGAQMIVIDDDDSLRESLSLVLEGHGLATRSFASSEAFLSQHNDDEEGCLLVDAYLPGMSGVDLLRDLKQTGSKLKAIMITGSSDVKMAVDAMKAGAIDFIEKPFNQADLLEVIDRVIAQSVNTAVKSSWIDKAISQIATLTARQKQVMDMVLAGHPSKNIAADLNISQRTVENHRASIMTKTGSKSLPALARLAVAAATEKPA